MTFYAHERIAIFIDGANVYGTTKALGFDIDYKRLLGEFSKRGTLVRAFYYTALPENEEYSPLRPLIDWLDYNGFTMVTKPQREYTDAMGRRRVRGNIDVELAVDAMEIADHVDHIILFSGDGDFRRLIEALQRKGKRTSVVSTVRTPTPMIADELRRQADSFIELATLQTAVQRAPLQRAEGDTGERPDRPMRPERPERPDRRPAPRAEQTPPPPSPIDDIL